MINFRKILELKTYEVKADFLNGECTTSIIEDSTGQWMRTKAVQQITIELIDEAIDEQKKLKEKLK